MLDFELVIKKCYFKSFNQALYFKKAKNKTSYKQTYSAIENLEIFFFCLKYMLKCKKFYKFNEIHNNLDCKFFKIIEFL